MCTAYKCRIPKIWLSLFVDQMSNSQAPMFHNFISDMCKQLDTDKIIRIWGSAPINTVL